MHLESRHLAPGTINLRLGAVRRLAYEAADGGLLSADLAAGIRRVKGVKKLGVSHLQQREGRWAIVDLAGKGGHIRTIPVRDWVYSATSDWMVAAGNQTGKPFRKVNSAGKP
jgi:hypothetical protein